MKDSYIEELITSVHAYNKAIVKYNFPQMDTEKIREAAEMAKYYHRDQKRMSGDPYYTHPIAVAKLITDYFTSEQNKVSDRVVIAGCLHDVIEDTHCTYDEISNKFGDRVREIVYKVTRTRDGRKLSVDQVINEILDYNDKESAIVKVFDRYHNLCTAQCFSVDKKIELGEESNKFKLLIKLGIDNIDMEKLFVQIATYYECGCDKLKAYQKYVPKYYVLPSTALDLDYTIPPI